MRFDPDFGLKNIIKLKDSILVVILHSHSNYTNTTNTNSYRYYYNYNNNYNNNNYNSSDRSNTYKMIDGLVDSLIILQTQFHALI